MPSPDPASEKARLRTEARRRRRDLAAADPSAAARLAARALDHAAELGLAAPAVVGGYWPMGDEIDPRPLLDRLVGLGVRCALAALSGPGALLEFRAWTSGAPMVDGPHRTVQPGPEAPVRRPDVVLVPLLAFDGAGYRLGWGGGYYDRVLAALRAAGPVTALGLAYDGQRIDRLPREPHDQPLDRVVTEAAVVAPAAVP